MPSAVIRKALARAFSCWPSRIGAASLLALALSWGSEALADADAPDAPQTFAASD